MGKPFAASRPLAQAKESAIVKRCGSYSDVSHKVQMSSSNLVGTPGSVGHTAPSPHLPAGGVTPCGPWGGSKPHGEDAFPPTHLVPKETAVCLRQM